MKLHRTLALLAPCVPCPRRMEAELAALSPAERASPAYLADGKPTRASGLAEGTSARPVSKLNPNVFDPRKPKHSIQLITLGTTRYMPAVYSEVQKQLDFAALVALLE